MGLTRFAGEGACSGYLSRLRWPAGFVCKRCGVIDDGWPVGTFDVGTAGRTGTRLPERPWMRVKGPLTTRGTAAWLATAGKNRMSVTTLERTMGWWATTLRGLPSAGPLSRRVRSERPRRSGSVETDETPVGGVSPGGRCQCAAPKPERVSSWRSGCCLRRALAGVGCGCRRRLRRRVARRWSATWWSHASVPLTDAWLGYDRVGQCGCARVATDPWGNPEAVQGRADGVPALSLVPDGAVVVRRHVAGYGKVGQGLTTEAQPPALVRVGDGREPAGRASGSARIAWVWSDRDRLSGESGRPSSSATTRWR